MTRTKRIPCLFLLLLAAACAPAGAGSSASPAPASAAAEAQDDYGYSQRNPIKVGGFKENRGPRNQREYLQRLRGPQGQRVRFMRRGSCCQHPTPNGINGEMGMLDIYEVTYDGLDEPIELYISFYDYEQPRAPRGFTLEPAAAPGTRASERR